MRIVVLGTGHVGLVSAACFVQGGHRVTRVDIDEAKVTMLCRGEVPIHELELEKLIADGRRRNRLNFISNLAAAVTGADIVYIAVGHPQPARAPHATPLLAMILPLTRKFLAQMMGVQRRRLSPEAGDDPYSRGHILYGAHAKPVEIIDPLQEANEVAHYPHVRDPVIRITKHGSALLVLWAANAVYPPVHS